MVSVLEGLSGKKHSETGEYGYGVRSILEDQSRKGVLYPLEDAFYFLPDPAIRIFYKDVWYLSFGVLTTTIFLVHYSLNFRYKNVLLGAVQRHSNR